MIVPPRVEPGGPPRWARRMAFGGALAVLITLVPVLGRYGLRAALRSDGGGATDTSVDQRSPGYQALVSPTPTLLALHVGPDGQLTGATLLASGGEAGGGAVLLIPVTTLVDVEGPRPRTLQATYAAGGQQAAAEALATLFRIGFSEVVSVQPASWTSLLAQSGPVTVDNPDDVLEGDEVRFPAGPTVLGGDDVESYLRLRNPGEDDRARLFRAELFWRAWLAASGTAPTTAPPTSARGSGAGLAAMMADLARAPSDVLTLPVTPQPDGAGATPGTGEPADEGLVPFLADPAQTQALIADLVPFPTSSRPGERVRVRLLDGVGDAARALDAAAVLVPAGAEIAVYGNADHFTYETSVVEYYDPAQRANAEAMLAALGVGSVTFRETVDASVDVTVIVGSDYRSVERPSPRDTVPRAAASTSTTITTS